MILKSITLHNIRSHTNTSVEFGDGITLLRGDMGSGKSTMLMAAEFALFGMGSLRADALVTKGQSRGEVLLSFEAGGSEYEVHRAITVRNGRASQADTRLVQDGVAEILNPTDLKARVLGVLGFREPSNPRAVSRVYRYAVYTPQEEIKAILSGDGREETIRRAFGMDDYKTTYDNAKAAASRMDSDMNGLKPRFERLDEFEEGAARAGSEAKRLGADLKRLGAERAAAASAVSEAEGNVERLDRELARAEAAAGTVRRLESDLESEKAEMSRLANELGAAETESEAAEVAASEDPGHRPTTLSGGALDEMISEARGRDVRSRELAASLKALAAEAATLSSECFGRNTQDIEADIKTCGQAISGLKSDVTSAEKSHRKSADGLAAMKQEAISLRESLERAEGLGAECEWCGTTLDEGHGKRLAAERRKKLERVQGDIEMAAEEVDGCSSFTADTRNKLDAARNRLGGLERALDAAEKLGVVNQKITDAEAEAGSLKGNVADAGAPKLDGEPDTQYLERVRRELTAWTEASSRAALARKDADVLAARIREMASRYEAAKGRAERLEAEIAERRSEAAEAERVSSDAVAARAELDARRAEMDRIISSEAAAAERRAAAEAEDKRLRGEAAEARMHKMRHAELGDCAAWIRSPFLPALRSIESQVMASTLYEFREHYREWYTILVDDHTKRSGIGEGFTPTIQQDGIEQDLANLSGGERTSVALAYRLALNAMVRRQAGILDDNLLVLDEPTDGFSREQMSKVLDILARLDARQVIIVSHEPEMEGYADTVYRVTKSDGRSSVSRVAS